VNDDNSGSAFARRKFSPRRIVVDFIRPDNKNNLTSALILMIFSFPRAFARRASATRRRELGAKVIVVL
jgi:hypothetical protein